ncbi:MAG: ABC transporter ATP-binding protein [Oscillospiraceae bacterium]|nr:ABC transporter ATP-binding protein [Oscillospiraceae bacterium]
MLKTLSKSIREYKKTSVKSVVYITLEVIFEILIPLCMARLLDKGIIAGQMNVVIKYGVILLVLALLQLATGMLAAVLSARAAAGFAANLRHDIFKNVQTFSFSNIDRFSTASIVTRLTTDVTNVQNAYQMIIRMAVRSPGMLIFSLAVAFSIDHKISLIFLAVIPALGFLLYLIIRKVFPIFERVFKRYDKLNNVVQENLRGIRVVKSFNQEKHETGKFNAISEEIFSDFTRAEKIIALNSPIMQFFMYGCLIFISWFGAKAIVLSSNNELLGLTTGQLTALITYAIQILVSLMMLSMVFAMITIAQSSAQRITEILNETSDITNPQQPVTEVENGSVTFDHVSFMYKKNADKKVLDDISFSIRTGETVGIIGATGSSKSSLIQLIPRLYDTSGGSVSVSGKDVRSYDLDVLRNEVAVVLQKNVLFSGTIKENLRYGNENASDEEIELACRLSCADEFISSMKDGYDTYIEQGGTNVSGGQKQRLCIARALIKKPKILILDDSTSAVDTKTDAIIQKSFKSYIPETTKIIIAQRISSVQNADKIIVLDDGKINAIGTHEELLKSCSIYSEIFETQMKGASSNE